MFNNLSTLPADPILGLMASFRNDTRSEKVDLGVGVYKNEEGNTPVLKSIKSAENWLHNNQNSKAYVGPAGNPDFNRLIPTLLFGQSSQAVQEGRIALNQTTGGCGALRVAAELIKSSNPNATVWVSDPTWGNHVPLLGNSGLKLESYPYYDKDQQKLNFEAMAATLSQLGPNDLVLLHASCHNPTGVDLNPEQWQEVLKLAQTRGFVPFIDMAYQGFAESLDADAYGLRLLAENLDEVLFAMSCSKNFGLYRERVGAVGLVCQNTSTRDKALTHIASIVRGIYSMPPDHGAALVARVLSEPALFSEWESELDSMRKRIQGLRQSFSAHMRTLLDSPRFDFVEQQYGMFSFLGISEEEVNLLASRYGIYMLESSRASIAGLNMRNLAYVCESICKILHKS